MAVMDEIPAAPVGTPVHYVNPVGLCRAAIVTEVGHVGQRDLHVFHQRELGHRPHIDFDEEGRNMSWHTFDPNAEPGCRMARDEGV